MEIKKELSDISWLVSESEYRADDALSYSAIAKYEREGFNNIEHLYDKIETPSLTHGSAVDAIITGGEEEFNNNFFVSEFPNCSDNIKKIVKELFNNCSSKFNELSKIPNEVIIFTAKEFNYQNNWKPTTRVDNIKEKGSRYYKLLYLAKDKTILNTQEYQDVINSVEALKTSKATEFYFAPNNPFEPIKRYYQLKFKATLEGVDYRCMPDELLVRFDTKEIFPIDLKTSSHTEWDFYKSFIDWFYMIQARLYYRIIKANLEKDDYFKDFTIHDYKFIVVNKKTLTPLVWDYPNTKAIGTLYYGKNKQIVCRDPYEIGKELYYYLSSRPKVPIGIKNENNLVEWLNKM